MKTEQLLNDLLMHFCRSISNRRLYFADHPKVLEYSVHFLKLLNQFFQQEGKKELFIGIIDGNFIYEGKKMVGPSIVGKQFILITEMLHCGGITFTSEITKADINRFMNLTATLYEPVKSLAESRELLTDHGIKFIKVAHSYEDNSALALAENKGSWQGKDMAGLLESPTLVYQALFDMVSKAHGAAALDSTLDLDNARAVSEFMLQFIHSSFSDIMQHIHYPDYDSYTIGHSVRVAALAVHAGTCFGWDDKFLLDVGTAALLHDIGKSKVSSDILYKHGNLDAGERQLMQHHCRIGAEILLAQENSTSMDIAAAWGHHLRYDGKGYPEQPQWAPRHPVTSLLHICDVFEALTAIRPYKAAMTPHQAFGIMLKDKGAYHPALLASFIKVVGLYPPGTIVKLSDNSTGRVIGTGKAIDKPRVMILKNSMGYDLEEAGETYEVDLYTQSSPHLKVKKLLLNYMGDSSEN